MIKPHLLNLRESSTLAINELSNQLLKNNKTIYKFGFGQSPFPIPKIIVDELRRNAFQKDYLPVKGLLELRESVSLYYNSKWKLDYSPENIIIGPGSKELMFLLQLVYKGDVIIPAPSWVSYGPQLQLLNKKYSVIEESFENKYLLSPETFENWLLVNKYKGELKLLILNYPNNPNGADYSEKDLQHFADICRKNNIIVLSDEIYAELNHNNNHFSIASYYPEGTIVSSGLSKWCGAGGWRLGTFAIPPELTEIQQSICIAASETFSSVSAPIQYAAVTAFQGSSEIENFLTHSRDILKEIGNWIFNKLSETKIKIKKPEGGFYIFPDFSNYRDSLIKRGINDSNDLSNRLLKETGIASLPGTEFLCNSDKLVLRMAYVNFNGKNALSNSMNGKNILDNDCVELKRGINKLVEWINKE